MNKTLGQKVVKGIGWNFGGSVIVRLTQFLATVLLARLLLPAEFGLFAIGSMIVTALSLFRDYGLGEAVLFFKEDLEENSNTAFIMSAFFGFAAWLAIFAGAPYIALAFDNPLVVWPLRIMGISIILTSLSLVPAALLERELEFRKRVMPELGMGLSHAIVSVTLAALGFGVWSLVTGYLASNLVFVTVAWKLAGWRPAFTFSRASAGRLLGFSKPLMASTVLALAFFYIDQAAIGRKLGVAILGCYTMAFTICHMPATNMAFVINQVMYPAYLKLNDDIAAVKQAYLQVVRVIALIAFPIALWLCLLSQDFIVSFFGAKWQPAVPLVRILAFYGLFRAIGSTAGSLLMALGHTKSIFRINCIQLGIALPLVYPVVLRLGASGVAALFASAFLIAYLYAFARVIRTTKMPLTHLLRAFLFPITASVLAVGTSFALSRLLPPGAIAAIGSLVFTILLYGLAVLKFDKKSIDTLRWALGRRK